MSTVLGNADTKTDTLRSTLESTPCSRAYTPLRPALSSTTMNIIHTPKECYFIPSFLFLRWSFLSPSFPSCSRLVDCVSHSFLENHLQPSLVIAFTLRSYQRTFQASSDAVYSPPTAIKREAIAPSLSATHFLMQALRTVN